MQEQQLLKAVIKEDLLVTREIFEERFRFVEERFKRTKLYLKVIILIGIVGLTAANPLLLKKLF